MAKETGIAGDQLKSLVERIERLEEEVSNIRADVREIYGEAKGMGFEPKYIRQIIKLRKMDPDEREESEEILSLYRQAIGL